MMDSMATEGRMVEVEGPSSGGACRLWVREWEGPGDGTLLFLHGWPGAGSTWDPLLEPLSRHRRVVAPDLPGFGRSDAPDAPYDLSWFTEVLLGLLRSLGPGPVALVGHGLGGAIALACAAMEPERVSRLVLAAPSVRRNPYAGIRARVVASPFPGPQVFRLLTGRAGVRAMLERHYHEPGHPQPGTVDRILEDLARPGHRRAAWRALVTDIDPSADGLLPSVTCPVTLIWGYNDRVQPMDEARWLERTLPRAALRLVPNAGHLVMQTRPRAFAAHLCAALDLPLPEGIPDGQMRPA